MLIAAVLIVAVAARPRLTLRGNKSAGASADKRANRGALTAAGYPANDGTSSPAEQSASDRIWILRGRVLYRCGDRDCE